MADGHLHQSRVVAGQGVEGNQSITQSEVSTKLMHISVTISQVREGVLGPSREADEWGGRLTRPQAESVRPDGQ